MNDTQRQRLNLLAKRFDEWLAALHYSPKTRTNYSRDVRGFLGWLAENTAVTAIADVTPSELQQYQMAIYNTLRPAAADGEPEKRLSVGSQACRLAAVRKFFAWLLADQQIATNPASSLQMPQQPRRLPRNVLTRSEARRLIEATPIKKPRDIRDHALLELLYATGIRRAELIELSLYDLDLEAGTLRVHGKGDATRLVPLTTSAKAALQLYLEEARPIFSKACSVSRQPRTTNPEPRLFVSTRSGGPLDDADIVRIVAKAARRAKISKHITPHTLRHSCATHLLKGKADIRQIQKLLGHRRLSSTEIYTHVEISDLAEVLHRCHPRGKKVTSDK
jgi:integrase/recombinase XerD